MNHSEHPLAVGEVITAAALGPGSWIVIAARWAGGGQNFDGPFPDGWAVTLIPESRAPLTKRLAKQQTRYQDGTGSFCAEYMLGAFSLVDGAKRRMRVR